MRQSPAKEMDSTPHIGHRQKDREPGRHGSGGPASGQARIMTREVEIGLWAVAHTRKARFCQHGSCYLHFFFLMSYEDAIATVGSRECL